MRVAVARRAPVWFDLTGDLRLHNKLLHGMGVICGLKLRCSKDREQIILGKGYALDCEGDLLHNAGDRAIDLVARAATQGLLDNAGNGKVNLWVGDADDYFLNNAVHRLKAVLDRKADPKFDGRILIEMRRGHASGGWTNKEMLDVMARRAGVE